MAEKEGIKTRLCGSQGIYEKIMGEEASTGDLGIRQA
jgi:hypothetical protein